MRGERFYIAFSRGRNPSAGVKERSFLLGREPIISRYTGGTYYDIGRIVRSVR